MADIPFAATPNPSADLVVSDNGFTSVIPAPVLKTATYIIPDPASLESHGQLALPVGQAAIKSLLLQDSDLIIIQQDGSILVINDFLGALETGVLTGVRLSDGTSMDAIDFLDAFGDGEALNDIMYSLEAASIEGDVVDETTFIAHDAPYDALGETLDFTGFPVTKTQSDNVDSSRNETAAPFQHMDLDDQPLSMDGLSLHPLGTDTLEVSALLGTDMENALEPFLPHNPDEPGQHSGPLTGQETAQTLSSSHAFSYQPGDAIGFTDPATDDITVL